MVFAGTSFSERTETILNPESSVKFASEKTSAKTVGSLPWAQPDFCGNEHHYVSEAITSTWISGGHFVNRFEHEFAQYSGSRYAMTSSNGTTALHMALLALSVGPGDEVVVPGFAFMAAANVALHLGAKPVFTEVDPATWCMTAKDLERCLSPRTKAIIPVHTYGNVCEMDQIIALAEERSIIVVEDAAEAFASRYKDRQAGSMGQLGTFSFQATKTITTGEGGMVITDSPEFRDKMYLFRNHGMHRPRYWHEVPGHNFRLTNLQAAMGCAQLERIDQIIRDRRRVCDVYRKYLSNIPGVTMQCFGPDVEPVVWAIAARLDLRAYPQGRDEVMRQLDAVGIETRNGFYAASLLRHIYDCARLPICEDLSREVISLPTYCTLQDNEIHFICSQLGILRR
jgi:perosamine synthetase